MTTVARMLYDAAGRPDPRKTIRTADGWRGPCYVCGLATFTGDDRGAVRVKDACPPTYNDHDTVNAPWSDYVCIPCAWAMTGRPPDTLRMWTVCYAAAWGDSPPKGNDKAASWPRVCLTTKADTRPVWDLLTDPPRGPWSVSVAVSGQIHVVPLTPVNRERGQWAVRIERETVRSTPERFRELAEHASILRAAGFREDDILMGEPHPASLARHLDTWRTHWPRIERYRHSATLRLCLWTLRKGLIDELRQRREVAQAGHEAGAGGHAVGEHGQDPPDRLVDPGADGARGGGGDGRDLPAPRVGDGTPPPDRGVHRAQLAFDL